MRRRRFSLDIRPGAVALLAGLYFLLPLRWCARLALAVTVHELGHVAALVLCGTEIYGLRMEGCGLALRCAPPGGHGAHGRSGGFRSRRRRGAVLHPAWAGIPGGSGPEPAVYVRESAAGAAARRRPARCRRQPRHWRGSMRRSGCWTVGACACRRADGAWRGAVCARDGTRTGRIWRVACTFAAGNDLPRGKNMM